MNNLKKLSAVLLILVLVMTFSVGTAFAEDGDVFPTKFRYYYNEGNMNRQEAFISLADVNYRIDNITTSSSKLTAKLTWERIYQNSYDNSQVNEYRIGLFAEKEGTYTVKYDVVDLDGNVISKHSMKVYAYKSPVTSLTLGGKTWGFLSGTSGKVSVKLNSKNPIQKIEYGVYKFNKTEDEYSTHGNTDFVYKTVKNNGTVKYGKQPYKYLYEYENTDYNGNKNFNYQVQTELYVPTVIRVTYKDQYTKRNETVSQWFYKPVK